MKNKLAEFFVNISSVHKFWITLEFFGKIYGSLSDLIPLNLPSEQIRIQTNNPNPWKFRRWKSKLLLVSSESSLLTLSPDLFRTAGNVHFFPSRLMFLKCEERKVWTTQTKFCQHLESCSVGQGKASVDSIHWIADPLCQFMKLEMPLNILFSDQIYPKYNLGGDAEFLFLSYCYIRSFDRQ